MQKIIYVLLVVAFTAASCNQKNETMKTFDPAFAHTVYFWFKEPDNEAHKSKFEASLKNFMNNSKYAKTKFIGTAPNASRDVVDGSFTYSLIVTFESAEAQKSYQNEAAHLVFVEECKGLWKSVIVYDSNGI